MATTAESLDLLTTEVSDAAANLRESLIVSANVTRNLFETQAIFLTHIKK
jgi:hypothetical protein